MTTVMLEPLEHEAALDLAALALDGPLPPPDAERLAAHLAGCAACRVTDDAMRGDARLLGELARADAPPRVREAIVRRASGDPEGSLWSWVFSPLASGLQAGTALVLALGAFLISLIAVALMVAGEF